MEDSTKSRVDPTLSNPTTDDDLVSQANSIGDSQRTNNNIDTNASNSVNQARQFQTTTALNSDDDSTSPSLDSHLSKSSNSASNLTDNNDSDHENNVANLTGLPTAPPSQTDPEDPNEKIVKATFAKFLDLQVNDVELEISQQNSSTNTDGNAASSSTDHAPTQTQTTDTTSDSGKTYSVQNKNINGRTAGTITIEDIPDTIKGKTIKKFTFKGFKKNINQNNPNGEDADLDAALIYLKKEAKTLKRGETLEVSGLNDTDSENLKKAIEEDKKNRKNKNYETLSKLLISKNGKTIKFHKPTYWELIKAFFARIGEYMKKNPMKTIAIALFIAATVTLAVLTAGGVIPAILPIIMHITAGAKFFAIPAVAIATNASLPGMVAISAYMQNKLKNKMSEWRKRKGTLDDEKRICPTSQ